MIDIITRALRSPLDYIRALQTHTLVLKKQIDEGNDVYSFIFEPTKPINWKAGQHAIFSIPDKKITGKKWRAFSIASAPSEKEIRITTVIKEPPSSFKNTLRSLSFGSSIVMNGPFGEFYVRKTQNIVGIASGVGITPFRSILKEIVKGNLPDTHLHLLYSSKNPSHTFGEEFQTFTEHPQITIDFLNSQDIAVEKLESIATVKNNDVAYYISGSPLFIDRVRTLLQSHSIDNIINDPFKGY